MFLHFPDLVCSLRWIKSKQKPVGWFFVMIYVQFVLGCTSKIIVQQMDWMSHREPCASQGADRMPQWPFWLFNGNSEFKLLSHVPDMLFDHFKTNRSYTKTCNWNPSNRSLWKLASKLYTKRSILGLYTMHIWMRISPIPKAMEGIYSSYSLPTTIVHCGFQIELRGPRTATSCLQRKAK